MKILKKIAPYLTALTIGASPVNANVQSDLSHLDDHISANADYNVHISRNFSNYTGQSIYVEGDKITSTNEFLTIENDDEAIFMCDLNKDGSLDQIVICKKYDDSIRRIMMPLNEYKNSELVDLVLRSNESSKSIRGENGYNTREEIFINPETNELSIVDYDTNTTKILQSSEFVEILQNIYESHIKYVVETLDITSSDQK